MNQLVSATQPDLGDKIILVTGAGDGIGKAVAIGCGRLGATVILLGKTVKKLEATYDALVEAGAPQPAIYPMNFEGASADDFDQLANTVDENFGRLDGLFNNIGWHGACAPLELFDIELWYKVMQVNLNAPFMLTRACIPLVRKSSAGSIVFNTDEKATAYWGAYGIAKAGIDRLSAIVGDELENEGVCVNAFDPGAVRSGLRKRAFPGEDSSGLATPDDVAKYFVSLLSGEIASQQRVLKAEDFS